MYRYTEFDRAFVRSRAAQFRDQLERWQDGRLDEEAFRPLRLQNGWYVQRHAPMLRVAVPYGELSSAQLRVLARIARDYDVPEPEVYRRALDAQRALGTTRLPTRHAHFTTRTNVQFNWIPLERAADVMDLLATVDMHGIQTSGNCIRNISCDERAGVAPDEIADPRPFAEIMRSGPPCIPSSPSCRASSRSPSRARPRIAPPPPGTTSGCGWCTTRAASWAFASRPAAAWAARR